MKINLTHRDFITTPDIAPPELIDFYFEYDTQKKLIKKTSGIYSSNGYFLNNFYTSLIYKGNKVTVEEFSSLATHIVFKNTNYYTLNNKNQIIIREIPDTQHNDRYKKYLYKYDNNKLIEITTTLPNRPYDINKPYYSYVLTYSEKLYYDSNGNLSKTEYYEQHDGVNVGNKIIRTFEDYDTSYNPTKRLFLLEEYFYRSLSNNNFRKYTKNTYGEFNNLISFSTTSLGFTYDSSGNIIIN